MREIGERIYTSAWSGSTKLEMVDPDVHANAKHHARIVAGERASASRREPGALRGSGLPG
jgi:hypothetical protein